MSGAKSTPRDAQVMAAVLKDIGITEHEPRVINQMLEFAYRYVTDVLDDAKVYATHANKRNIDSEDVKLAIQCKLDHSFTTPPPRELLMELAGHKNNSALPLIKPYTGPKLPPLDRCCLISPNYRLKSLKKVTAPKVQMQSGASLVTSLTSGSRLTIQQHHGGATGLVRSGSGQLSLVTLGTSQPTVTIKPAVSQIQQSAVTMPILRLPQGSTTASSSSSISGNTFTISGGSLKRKREDDDDYDKP